MKLKSLKNANPKGKTILLRTDFNVPLNKAGEVTDSSRIEACIPTINHLLDNGNKVIITSHLGRPDGKYSESLSLTRIIPTLEKLLQKKVPLLKEINKTKSLQLLEKSSLIILENIRFQPGEKTNSPQLAASLAELADVFVNDAFSVCHRKHCSVSAITKTLPACAGLLLEKELTQLERLHQDSLPSPITLLLGGAKVSTKLPLTKYFLNKADFILLGGITANTFLASQDINIQASKVDDDQLENAQETLEEANNSTTAVLLPEDALAATKKDPHTPTTTTIANLDNDQLIFDIGPETTKKYQDILNHSETIIFNGPLGWTENDHYLNATKTLLKTIASKTSQGALTMIGGGDSVALLKKCEISTNDFVHVSLGGGAMLEYITNPHLPGLIPLYT